MQIKRLLVLVVLSVSGALCAASCVQNPAAPEGDGASPEPTTPGEAPISADERTEPPPIDAGRTGEAEDPLTKEQCYAQYEFQVARCLERMPQDLKPWCVAGATIIYHGCLKLAD